LSATGSADMSAAGLMTSFSLCLLAAAATPLLGIGSVLTQYARGSLHDAELWRLALAYENSRYFVLFNGKSIFCLKQKAVGFQLVFEHQRYLLGRLTALGLLHECVLARPLFLRRLDLLEACFYYLYARPPFSQHLDIPQRCVDVT
jgi:hypothetical protein